MTKLRSILAVSILSLSVMFIGCTNVKALELSGTTTDKTVLTEDTKLTDDVTLGREISVESGKSVTLDLNGHKLTAPIYEGTDYYAIDNAGELTIIDSASTKGEIVCTKKKTSCIRNWYHYS